MAEEHQQQTESEVGAEEPEGELPQAAGETAEAARAPAPEAAKPTPAEGASSDAVPSAETAKRALRRHLPRAERRQRPKPKREPGKKRQPIVRLEKPERPRGRRQQRRGVVVSSAMDKTIVVRVDTVKSHPRYKKIIRRSTKLHAHDERNEANVGDVVRIAETRPLSKTKRWRLVEIVEAAK